MVIFLISVELAGVMLIGEEGHYKRGHSMQILKDAAMVLRLLEEI